MNCCCTNILRLCGSTGTCTGTLLDLPYSGLTPGDHYKLKLNFLDSEIDFDLVADDEGFLQLPTETLNEKYEYTAKLFDAGNNVITVTQDDIIYDCIFFSTKFIFNV